MSGVRSRPVALSCVTSLPGLNLWAMLSVWAPCPPSRRPAPTTLDPRVHTCRGGPASCPPCAGCPADPGVSRHLLPICTSVSPAQRAVGPGAEHLSVLPGGRGWGRGKQTWGNHVALQRLQEAGGGGARPAACLRGPPGMSPAPARPPWAASAGGRSVGGRLQGRALKLGSLHSGQTPALHVPRRCLALHL